MQSKYNKIYNEFNNISKTIIEYLSERILDIILKQIVCTVIFYVS